VTIGRHLNIPYHLCKYLYWQADLRVRRQRPAEAGPLAAEAVDIATRIGRRDIRCLATLLCIRLRVALLQTTVSAAVREYEALLPQWSRDYDRAAIHYEAWRLGKNEHGHRRAAAVSTEHFTARLSTSSMAGATRS
jgi:hypothetical protein